MNEKPTKIVLFSKKEVGYEIFPRICLSRVGSFYPPLRVSVRENSNEVEGLTNTTL